MAAAVVNSAQSAGAANANTIALPSATAGNTLVSFYSESGSITQPTCSGFVVNATDSGYNTTDSVWVATKIAAGGETGPTWTPGLGGTGRGVCAWEVSGIASTVTLDGSPATTPNLSATTGSITVTTSVAGSIILIGVGGNASTGTISAWTGTNVATNIGTATARCMGGSFITTATVSSSFTANWSTSRVCAMLAIALQPPTVAATASGSTLMMMGV